MKSHQVKFIERQRTWKPLTSR